MEAAVEGGVGNWGEVVTRYPYRKVRMDHLLSKEKWNRKISYPMVDHFRSCLFVLIKLKRIRDRIKAEEIRFIFLSKEVSCLGAKSSLKTA